MRAKDELASDELVLAVRYLMQSAGIEKLRITGGEPLLAAKFDTFLPAVMALPLKDVSLTTNGQLLERKLSIIRDSGIGRINVSLDTLDPDRFRQIARGGELAAVLRGIDAALDCGIGVKINMVPLKTANADQVLPMLEHCLARGIELRFIELMRMGHLAHSAAYDRDFLPMQEILDAVARRHQFTRTDAPYDSTSVRYEIPGRGFFGIIANESEPFCASCTRLRLSSDGYLYGCLSNSSRHYIRDLLRQPQHVVLPRLQGILMSALADKQDEFRGEVTVMKLIGG